MRARILLVEDDPALRDLVARELADAGFDVHAVGRGGDALADAVERPPDLVVLDLGLPDVDGLDVAKRLHEDGVAILMLTARTQVEARVEGLYAGASDYMTKPFDVRELLARVHAHVRDRGNGGEEIVHGAIRLHVESGTVTVGEASEVLPTREADLLQLLLAHPGKVFPREELEHRLYGIESPDSNAVQVYVSRLRRTLAGLGAENAIVTLRGKGYTVP